MATYITSYYKDRDECVGCNIEAESFQNAEAIAMTLSAVERSLTNPEFTQLIVVGELVGEVEVGDEADEYRAAEMVCPHCDRCWIAVHPAMVEFLECPDCAMPCPVM